MSAIWALARKHRLVVIEDCAHAVGAHYRGWPIGAGDPSRGDYSDAAAFSFYATKNITTGEGGMLTTHREDVADRAKVLCLHGISKDAWNRYSDKGNWYYEVLEPGFKYNMSDIQSAIGIHQLRKLEAFTETRTRLAAFYNTLLGDVQEFELPATKADCRHAWHLYMLRLNLGKLEINRAEFMSLMRERGVGTSVHFIPIPLHPFFAPHLSEGRNDTPNALELYPRIVSLPLFPELTEEELCYIAECAKEIVRKTRKSKTFAVMVGGKG
jgi:dTDP-4-amino-4,6-dideoxygalactose transaminase